LLCFSLFEKRSTFLLHFYLAVSTNWEIE
jgi:hypothetical protein